MRPQTKADADFLQTIGETLYRVRMKCKADPFYLGQEVLGWDYRRPAEFQKQVVQAMKDEVSYLCLAPRGHGKTTLCEQVGIIWEIIRNPDIRILLCHGVYEKAKMILQGSTNHFKQNNALRRIFPEHTPQNQDESPTKTQWTTPARRRFMQEPTVMAAAPGSTVTGLHFDLIKSTDLVNEQNAPAPIGFGSPETMAQVTEFVKTFTPLLDATNPKARKHYDGTRWHDADAWGHLIDTVKSLRVIKVGLDDDENGDPIPIWDAITKERLIEDKQEAGPILWAANYRQDPLPPETALFRQEMFHEYTEEPSPLSIAITVDPALSERESADRTAIVVSGITDSGDLYVLSARAGRWSPKVVLDLLVSLDEEYKPHYIGIESVAFQKVFVFWANDYFRQNQGSTAPKMRPLIADGSKLRRAFLISNHAERRGIYVKKEHSELVDECCRFPAGKHDDFVDALAYRGQDLRTAFSFVKKQKQVVGLDLSYWDHKGSDLIALYDSDPQTNLFTILPGGRR